MIILVAGEVYNSPFQFSLADIAPFSNIIYQFFFSAARANRVPRMIHELLAAFDAVKGKLRLVLPGRRHGVVG